MKYNIAFLFSQLFILILLIAPLDSHAQIGKKLKRKLEEKAAKLLEKKEEGPKETPEKSVPTADSTANDLPDFSGMLGNSNITLPNSYDFYADMLVTSKNYDKSGKEKLSSQMRYFFSEANEKDPYMGMKVLGEGTEKATMIISTNQMIVLSEESGTKMAMVMPMKTISSSTESDAAEKTAIAFTKTGRTKTILGFQSEEYEGEDEDSKAQIWIATDLQEQGEKFSQLFGQLAKKQQTTQFSLLPLHLGMMLESNVYDKKTGERSEFTTQEINGNKFTSISTEGYQAMDMNSFMRQSQGKE